MDYFKRIIEIFTSDDFSESGQRAFWKWLSDEEHTDKKTEALRQQWERSSSYKADASTRASWNLFRVKAGQAALRDKAARRAMDETGSNDASISNSVHDSRNVTDYENPQSGMRRQKVGLRLWQSAAAVLLVMTVSSLYIAYKANQNYTSDNLLEEYVPVAATERVVLPDGSEVHLNSRSTLLYPRKFSRKNRSVYLSGEANFKVKEDKKRPFIVKSNDIRVTVLGTEFDLLAYPEDSLVKVTLLSGKVEAAFNNLQGSAVLEPNRQLVYNRNSRGSDIVRPDMESVTAWQRGEIVFKGTTLAEIVTVLERKYPYDFVYHDNLFRDDTYTFRFKDDAPLEEVMEIISNVVRYIDFRINDDTCFIERR